MELRKMKVFVTGVGGQLGYDVMKELEKRGYESYGSDLQENSIFSNLYFSSALIILFTFLLLRFSYF